jgi:hypothetical protein
MPTYRLQIVCPHCTRLTEIRDWPRTERVPSVFTCVTTHGGCGGQALVEPPNLDAFPQLQVYIVTPRALTPRQAAFLTEHAAHP